MPELSKGKDVDMAQSLSIDDNRFAENSAMFSHLNSDSPSAPPEGPQATGGWQPGRCTATRSTRADSPGPGGTCAASVARTGSRTVAGPPWSGQVQPDDRHHGEPVGDIDFGEPDRQGAAALIPATPRAGPVHVLRTP